MRIAVDDLNPFLDDRPGILEYAMRWGVAAVAVAVVVGLFFWRRSDFCIEVKSGKVAFHGKFPLAIRPACAEFLLRDLAIDGPARVYAIRQKDRWRLWFRGGIGEGEKQRIRNFIVTRLGSR
jgi:Protein of unknown function (DUF3634)